MQSFGRKFGIYSKIHQARLLVQVFLVEKHVSNYISKLNLFGACMYPFKSSFCMSTFILYSSLVFLYFQYISKLLFKNKKKRKLIQKFMTTRKKAFSMLQSFFKVAFCTTESRNFEYYLASCHQKWVHKLREAPVCRTYTSNNISMAPTF